MRHLLAGFQAKRIGRFGRRVKEICDIELHAIENSAAIGYAESLKTDTSPKLVASVAKR